MYSCIRQRSRGCNATVKLEFNENIKHYVRTEERLCGQRTRFICKFKPEAMTDTEVRSCDNYRILSANLKCDPACLDKCDTILQSSAKK